MVGQDSLWIPRPSEGVPGWPGGLEETPPITVGLLGILP